jgi:hypothetical protein
VRPKTRDGPPTGAHGKERRATADKDLRAVAANMKNKAQI